MTAPFVRRSTHQKALHEIAEWRLAYSRLLSKWNGVIEQINRRGGESFLYGPAAASKAFSQDEISTLIRLCHPDRHGGSEASTRLTQKLLSMRETLR